MELLLRQTQQLPAQQPPAKPQITAAEGTWEYFKVCGRLSVPPARAFRGWVIGHHGSICQSIVLRLDCSVALDELLQQKGNEFFVQPDYANAIAMYTKVRSQLYQRPLGLIV